MVMGSLEKNYLITASYVLKRPQSQTVVVERDVLLSQKIILISRSLLVPRDQVLMNHTHHSASASVDFPLNYTLWDQVFPYVIRKIIISLLRNFIAPFDLGRLLASWSPD